MAHYPSPTYTTHHPFNSICPRTTIKMGLDLWREILYNGSIEPESILVEVQDMTVQWVSTTARERDMVREINERGQEIERLRNSLIDAQRENARLREAIKRGPLTPAPKLKGEVLRPGAIGYITHVKITAQGKRAFEHEVGLTLCDMLILGIASLKPDDSVTFDKIQDNVPKTIAEKSKVVSYTNLLDTRGFLDITYEHIVPDWRPANNG